MATFTSHSPEQTFDLGKTWGQEAGQGWVIGLSGDLGAGKTQLVKGIAAGLGITDRVYSPTFGLINEYRGGRLPLFHLDLYRLNSPEDVVQAGLEEYLLNPNGVTVVEWVERWIDTDPLSAVKVSGVARVFRFAWIESTGENERRIVYEDFSR
jgi:tRNA threonylcarbamoyladenosine biosynthesis protein TsaE